MNGDRLPVSDPNDDVTWPSGYAMRPEGLMRLATGANQKDVRVSAPFQLAAMTRAAVGTSWGIQLKFRDTDGVPKSVVIPGVDLVGDGRRPARSFRPHHRWHRGLGHDGSRQYARPDE